MIGNGGVLEDLVKHLDDYYTKKHPDFFGPSPKHPVLPLKNSKILHDNLWGTNRFTWRELALIDSPIFQRLRDIHQTGLAYQVYMSAHHTRFEHSLGVVIVASRVFSRLYERDEDKINNIFRSVFGSNCDVRKKLFQIRQELRLAALLHDTGHSLLSHTSERVYGQLKLLKHAKEELSDLVGKEKGAGEVLSFCIAQTDAVSHLLERAKSNLLDLSELAHSDFNVDLKNIALIIVGRSNHPYLQFLGDIISSGFDADKPDYLVRDANNAGLSLQYDFERYLYSVRLERDILVDDEDCLDKMYNSFCGAGFDRKEPEGIIQYPYFETYRLRIPNKALNTIKQIVICKLMLFSYIYHHPKVRASEGLLERLINEVVKYKSKNGLDEQAILSTFLDYTDSSLHGRLAEDANSANVGKYLWRLNYRVLPREIYSLSSAVQSRAEGDLLKEFLIDIQDREMRPKKIKELEAKIGDELLKIRPELGGDEDEALKEAGVWVDVPSPPEFEDVDELMIKSGKGGPSVALTQIFPIGEWTQAYTAFRYQVRIFSFSEYCDDVRAAAKLAMQKIIGISGDDFYENTCRQRTIN